MYNDCNNNNQIHCLYGQCTLLKYASTLTECQKVLHSYVCASLWFDIYGNRDTQLMKLLQISTPKKEKSHPCCCSIVVPFLLICLPCMTLRHRQGLWKRMILATPNLWHPQILHLHLGIPVAPCQSPISITNKEHLKISNYPAVWCNAPQIAVSMVLTVRYLSIWMLHYYTWSQALTFKHILNANKSHPVTNDDCITKGVWQGHLQTSLVL